MHDGGSPSGKRAGLADTHVVGARPGDVLAGKYRVDRILGTGGVGVVVAATHLQLDQRVALKFLLPAALKDQMAVARFDREARAAAKLRSEHVARVSDVGHLDTGAPYMVMEYLEGRDLSVMIERAPLRVDLAVEYIVQACEAVAEAHAFGIVHRDLKPSNLFLTSSADGAACVKVLDFGISKILPRNGLEADLAVTHANATIGSPLYMSPEQMESPSDVDQRSDIWALGVTLYELLTATPAFDGPTMAQVCAKVMHGAPVPLRARAPTVPPELEAVVMRCLQKPREARFHDVGELSLALLPFAPHRAQASANRVVSIVRAAGVPQGLPEPPESSPTLPRAMGFAPSTQGAWGPVRTDPPRAVSRAPLVFAMVGFVVLVGGVVGGFVTLRRTQRLAVTAAGARASALPSAASSVEEPVTPSAATAEAAPPPSTDAAAQPSSKATVAPNATAPTQKKRAAHGSPAVAPAHTVDPSILDDR